MDTTDRELLSLLRENARLPVAALAKTLRVARGTVQNRLARMEKEGTIIGYTVKLKPQESPTADIFRITLDPGSVITFVAELRTDSLEAVDRVLGRIRQIDGISNTETSLLLSTHKF